MKKNIKRMISSVVSTTLLSAILLSTASCSSSSKGKQELIIYNWGEYIAEDTIAGFEAKYPQYNVVYRTFETNETMYPNLDKSYDVIVPSEYMVCRLIREERIQPIDWSLIPNATKYMDPMFNDLTFDEDKSLSDDVLNYAVPYLYCTVGLIYDANKITLPENVTDAETIWSILFDSQYANEIGMYDSMRESIGTALNYLGYSINSMNEAELQEALNLLIEQKGNIKPTYGVDNLKDKMVSGELVASVAWSGDHIVMLDRVEELGREDEVDLRLVVPEGSNWSVDMMCIPANAKNVQGAHDFINYMYEPDVALANCEYVGYSTPNTAAKDMLDEEVANNIYYYPDEKLFSSLEVYYSSAEYEERYTEIWNTVKASN